MTNGPAGDDPASSRESTAISQRSLGPRRTRFPLWPPMTSGAPDEGDVAIDYPLEIEFDLDAATLRSRLAETAVAGGLERWSPMLPPLAPGLAMGEGGTPLVTSRDIDRWAGGDGILIKDESRNPTWSHKDRLNLCAVSAAVLSGAPGIAVASSGNHGASAAAYAARAGLPCVLITAKGASLTNQAFMKSYGTAVVAVPVEARIPLLRKFVEHSGFMPVSSITRTHTGHPFGPEGYKTIAYELFLQLNATIPAAIFVPTGYAELLFGIWKGFEEIRSAGLANSVPTMIACEPAARGPLTEALSAGQAVAEVAPNPTQAFAIACTISSVRGHLAVTGSGGSAMRIADHETLEAQRISARAGLWPEFSSAIALAGIKNAIAGGQTFEGPIVAINTSSGMKDSVDPADGVPESDPEWDAFRGTLATHYGLTF